MDMHELPLAEENYGFASKDYSSILAFRAMVAVLVFSVTIILRPFVLFNIFNCGSIRKCNYVFLLIINLNGFSM